VDVGAAFVHRLEKRFTAAGKETIIKASAYPRFLIWGRKVLERKGGPPPHRTRKPVNTALDLKGETSRRSSETT